MWCVCVCGVSVCVLYVCGLFGVFARRMCVVCIVCVRLKPPACCHCVPPRCHCVPPRCHCVPPCCHCVPPCYHCVPPRCHCVPPRCPCVPPCCHCVPRWPPSGVPGGLQGPPPGVPDPPAEHHLHPVGDAHHAARARHGRLDRLVPLHQGLQRPLRHGPPGGQQAVSPRQVRGVGGG